MSERNRLINGRFLQDLSGWTANLATYSAGDGDDHYGIAALATGGGYIEQSFSIPRVRQYSIHVSIKPVGVAISAGQCTLRIQDGNGRTVKTQNLAAVVADTWSENTIDIGLATNTTYTLRITNVNATGEVRVDDVWIWDVPITRATIASLVDEKLGRLADDRAFSTTSSGTKTEGDYTSAIDSGLRLLDALNPEIGLPDVRYLNPQDVQAAVDVVEREMLERLQRDYAVEVDIRVGQRSESLSQIGKAVSEMASVKDGNPGRVVVKRLSHEDE